MDSTGQSTRFSRTHGRNISMANDCKSATWSSRYNGGHCFLENCFQSKDEVSLTIAGDGHVRIGVTTNRHQMDKFDRRIKDSNFLVIKLKKRSIEMLLRRDGSQVTLKENTDKFPSKLWTVKGEVDLYLEMLFGNLTVDINNDNGGRSMPTHMFSDQTCGSNVNITHDGKRARLLNPNSSAVCCIKHPMKVGEIIRLDVTPMPEATWVYTKLFLSNYSPREIEISNPGTQSRQNYTQKLVPFGHGLKVKSAGDILLRLEADGKVSYRFLMGVVATAAVPEVDTSIPIYVYVELFRMKTTIKAFGSCREVEPYLKPGTGVINIGNTNTNGDCVSSQTIPKTMPL